MPRMQDIRKRNIELLFSMIRTKSNFKKWVDLDQILAEFSLQTGIRIQKAQEYIAILEKTGKIELNSTNQVKAKMNVKLASPTGNYD